MIRPLLALALLGLPGIAHAADRSFLVGSFTRVRVDGPFAVTVVTGKSPGAKATGSSDALDALTVRVDGDTAVVTMGAGDWSSDSGQMITPPAVTLTTPTLNAAAINAGAMLTIDAMKGQKVDLALNGSGSLTVGAITADQLVARIVGTGQMTLAGKAQRAQVIVTGAGSVEASDLIAGDLTVRSDGPGRLDLAARYTANIMTTGLGPVTVAGSPSCTVRAAAGGPVRCGRQAD
ncbi:MAG: GIN domain-containing protein [Sphingomonas sp.]